MSKFSNFMKTTGEVLGAMADASFTAKKAPIDNIHTAVTGIDWDDYRANSTLYGLSENEIQTLRDAEYILRRFPRKY